MKTDGTNVWLTTHDIKILRRYKSETDGNAQEFARKLVKQGLATMEKQGVTNELQMELGKFLFYCVPCYMETKKEYWMQKLFGNNL